MAKSSTAVSTQLVASTDSLPAHLKAVDAAGRGNENVGSNVTIPRIKLMQKMSNEVDKHNPAHIEGCEPGHFVNTLLQKNYGASIYCINLTVATVYEVKRGFDFGGGLGGSFPSKTAAEEAINTQDKPEEWENVETHRHLILIKDPETGALDNTPCTFDFSASKLRVSKEWNSQIVMKGGDRFNSLWKLTGKPTESKAGFVFMNLELDWVGWAQEEDYKFSEETYTSIAENLEQALL